MRTAGGCLLDGSMMNQNSEFTPGIEPPRQHSGPALWFAFQGDRLLVNHGPTSDKIPCTEDFADLSLKTLRQHYFGQFQGQPCFAVEVAEGVDPPPSMGFEGLRALFDRLDKHMVDLAGFAFQIVEWDRTHQFCGHCGTPTETQSNERAKACPNCGMLLFPRLSPAVIVLVERGRELLLARSRRFQPGMYSVIAGFVELGETLEEAVVREVQEETGVSVKDVRYFGSQQWPFPHSLMVGFTAKYASGEITIDEEEIEDAGWYKVDNLPELPTKVSIARKMIDWFVSKQTESSKD